MFEIISVEAKFTTYPQDFMLVMAVNIVHV